MVPPIKLGKKPVGLLDALIYRVLYVTYWDTFQAKDIKHFLDLLNWETVLLWFM